MHKVTNKKQIIFELIQDFLVSLSLTITALLISKVTLSPMFVIKETSFAWVVNLLIGFNIPEKEWGDLICKKLKLKYPFSHFLTMFVIVLINVVGISLCVVLKNTGLHSQFFQTWATLLPWLLLVGYFAALIWFPVTNKIVNAICRRNSENEK